MTTIDVEIARVEFAAWLHSKQEETELRFTQIEADCQTLVINIAIAESMGEVDEALLEDYEELMRVGTRTLHLLKLIETAQKAEKRFLCRSDRDAVYAPLLPWFRVETELH